MFRKSLFWSEEGSESYKRKRFVKARGRNLDMKPRLIPRPRLHASGMCEAFSSRISITGHLLWELGSERKCSQAPNCQGRKDPINQTFSVPIITKRSSGATLSFGPFKIPSALITCMEWRMQERHLCVGPNAAKMLGCSYHMEEVP